MKKFKNKYRIDSVRLKNYDYSSNGAYFITICTKNRNNFFGEIVDGKMILNQIWETVWKQWLETPHIRPGMNLVLDEFVVMPNHVHGIIVIGDNEFNTSCSVETQCIASLPTTYKNKFGPQRKNLSSIIRGFKSAVTIKSREILPNFA